MRNRYFWLVSRKIETIGYCFGVKQVILHIFFYFSAIPSMAVLTFRLHWGKQDVSTRITGSASIEVICKIKQCFIGIIGGFRLETGYDLHTFFQNLRNNEKKRKAQIVSGSKRKIPRVFRHSNIKVSGLTTLVGAPDNRITVLYEQVLTPRGNDHSRYLNSI